MPAPAEYLTFLCGKGVKLWIDDGQLRYHAKRGALSSEELSRLRVMKDGIIAELTKTADVAKDDYLRMPPQTKTSLAPLSFQQQWLLGLVQQHIGWKQALAYAFRLTGALKPQILEKSLGRILRRHESLRTRVIDVEGVPRQQIDDAREFRLGLTQVAGVSTEERARNTRLLIREIAARPVGYAVAPLMTAQLLQVSEREWFLVLTVHRLVADCLSVSHVVRELWALYSEELREQPSPLSTIPVRYRDYAIWQQAMDVSWQQKHAGYWKEHLADAQRITWPKDEGVTCSARVLASLQYSFGDKLSAELRDLGRQTQTLSALVMLSVYASFVSRWCGQRDFVVPFLIAGRHSEHEGVVGYFSHLLYLRMKLSGSESAMDLLKQVSNEFYRAVFRQDFGRIAMQRPDLLGGTLCQWLSWHPADVVGLDTDDITREVGFTVETVRFQSPEDLANVPPSVVDIEVSFFEVAGDICALAIYRHDLFGERTIVRLMREMRSVAEQFVGHSRAPVSAIPG